MTVEERLGRIETKLDGIAKTLDTATEKHEKRIAKVESSVNKIYGVLGLIAIIWPQLYNWLSGTKS